MSYQKQSSSSNNALLVGSHQRSYDDQQFISALTGSGGGTDSVEMDQYQDDW